jgi:hypothetical protein
MVKVRIERGVIENGDGETIRKGSFDDQSIGGARRGKCRLLAFAPRGRE